MIAAVGHRRASGAWRETFLADGRTCPSPIYCAALQVLSKPVILEGYLEKKGHGLGVFNWATRLLVVRMGELSYFKPDEIENALNIIPLVHGAFVCQHLARWRIDRSC